MLVLPKVRKCYSFTDFFKKIIVRGELRLAAPGFYISHDTYKLVMKMNNELHITAPFPPSVNHYMGYRAIMRGGKPLAIPYKTADAVKFCKNFSSIVKDAVKEQG